MKIDFSRNKIELEKNISELDKFVLDFVSVLNKLKIKYVIVSGYVSILFGRSRVSEDIDIIVEKLDYKKFKGLWDELEKDFYGVNIGDSSTAYKEYLLNNNSIRFSKKGEYIPNIEFKFPKEYLDVWTLKNRLRVLLNNNELFISQLELQIPFKLYLGSEKDIEDARHLYKMFKDKLNIKMLEDFNRKLKIEKLFNKYLR